MTSENCAVHVNVLDVAIQNIDLRVGDNVIYLDSEFMRQPTIVRIKKRDPIAASSPDTQIACGRLPLILLAKVSHTHIAAVVCNNRRSFVGGPVINDNKLPVFVILRENTFDCLSDEVRPIVCRHYN